jgi:hypothetical protein
MLLVGPLFPGVSPFIGPKLPLSASCSPNLEARASTARYEAGPPNRRAHTPGKMPRLGYAQYSGCVAPGLGYCYGLINPLRKREVPGSGESC